MRAAIGACALEESCGPGALEAAILGALAEREAAMLGTAQDERTAMLQALAEREAARDVWSGR